MTPGSPDMKILVVDDFPTMRRIVKTLLRQCGYKNFLEAQNGQEAIDLLRKSSDVELIVSDWNMPEMTGLDFLKAVRADAKLRHLPFLMIAAEDEKDGVMEASKYGMNGYVVKPFTGQTLADKLAKILVSADNKQAS